MAREAGDKKNPPVVLGQQEVEKPARGFHTNMKKTEDKKAEGLMSEIFIPEGIEAELSSDSIKLKKGQNEIIRKLERDIIMSKEGNKIIITAVKSKKAQRREVKTFVAHLNNMIIGLQSGFEYELEICNVHFPMTVLFDKAKKDIIIKNILGEKYPRTLKVSDKVSIEIKAPKIIVKSYDLEAAGQTAADLEKVTKIRYRDRNKFQDGIFITKKPGKIYL